MLQEPKPDLTSVSDRCRERQQVIPRLIPLLEGLITRVDSLSELDPGSAATILALGFLHPNTPLIPIAVARSSRFTLQQIVSNCLAHGLQEELEPELAAFAQSQLPLLASAKLLKRHEDAYTLILRPRPGASTWNDVLSVMNELRSVLCEQPPASTPARNEERIPTLAEAPLPKIDHRLLKQERRIKGLLKTLHDGLEAWKVLERTNTHREHFTSYLKEKGLAERSFMENLPSMDGPFGDDYQEAMARISREMKRIWILAEQDKALALKELELFEDHLYRDDAAYLRKAIRNDEPLSEIVCGWLGLRAGLQLYLGEDFRFLTDIVPFIQNFGAAMLITSSSSEGPSKEELQVRESFYSLRRIFGSLKMELTEAMSETMTTAIMVLPEFLHDPKVLAMHARMEQRIEELEAELGKVQHTIASQGSLTQ